jgi:radical SAM superfamily enzyme YgiQ (UPF0313 family)
MSPSPMNKSVLLVNPWIHDFAAYDLWMKPLGLLHLGGILRAKGYRVSLVDCLELGSLPVELTANLKPPPRKENGRGHLYKEVIPKPWVLRNFPRRYRRYGIPPERVREWISRMPVPDLICLTSSMTYWYPGVVETVEFLRRVLPGVPILLGGIYATLCPDHAQENSGADRVLPGPWDGDKSGIIAEILGGPIPSGEEGFLSWPYPAFDLYPGLAYVCLLTRCGCPFSCTYCAASRLAPGFLSRPPQEVVGEIQYWWERFGVRDFALYDDALLISPRQHILPLLQELISRKMPLRFHTPNALHVRGIDGEVARCLFLGGFKTIRLGLETAEEGLQAETGGKVDNEDFRRAVQYLKRAGYEGREIGAYLIAGLPGQGVEEVEESIAFVKENGARPILVEYSPIPGTALFAKAKQGSPFDLEKEPLFHNNSLLPCRGERFTWADFRRVKDALKA